MISRWSPAAGTSSSPARTSRRWKSAVATAAWTGRWSTRGAGCGLSSPRATRRRKASGHTGRRCSASRTKSRPTTWPAGPRSGPGTTLTETATSPSGTSGIAVGGKPGPFPFSSPEKKMRPRMKNPAPGPCLAAAGEKTSPFLFSGPENMEKAPGHAGPGALFFPLGYIPLVLIESHVSLCNLTFQLFLTDYTQQPFYSSYFTPSLTKTTCILYRIS